MKAPRSQVAQVIAKQTQGGTFDKHEAHAIAGYLLQQKRTAELDSLVRDVQAVWASNGYIEVLATSAHELTTTARRDIEVEARKLYPAAKQVVITPRIDPDVIGGVQLQVVAYQLDLSTKGKLQQFRAAALEGSDRA